MPKLPTAGSGAERFLTRSAVIFLAVLFAANAAAGEIGIIVADDLNLRPEPGTHAAPITTLKKGSEVEILDKEKDWLKVRHANRIGYILDKDAYVHVLDVDSPAGREGAKTAASTGSKIEKYQKEVDDIQRRIDDAETRVRDYTDREVSILTSLNDIDYSIDRAGRRIAKNKSELVELEKKIKNTRKEYVRLVDTLEKNQDYTAARLVALYKMNALGAWQSLASSKSLYEMLQRKRYLEAILEHDDVVITEFLRDKNAVKKILDQLNAQQIEKRRIEASIQKHIEELSAQKALRSRILEDVRAKKSLQIAAIHSLKNAAEALDTQIQALNRTTSRPLEDLTIESFSELKGLLKMPVKGKIIHFYGPHKDTKFNVTVFRSGIDIQAPKDSPVQAVFAGRILYADWFKGYGNMIIIDHGSNYYTVYAHLQEISVQKGDFVSMAEDIATLGETGSIMGPILHFEVRHHGKPMDPLEWLVKK